MSHYQYQRELTAKRAEDLIASVVEVANDPETSGWGRDNLTMFAGTLRAVIQIFSNEKDVKL